MMTDRKDYNKLLKELQDDAIDEYNDRNITFGEMVNILKWCTQIMDSLEEDSK